MRFSVPQYITIEDKLMGLVTFRQLFLLLGAFFITFAAFKLLPAFFSLIIGFIAFGIAVALGWLQINGRSLLSAVPEVFGFFFSTFGKKYLWRPTPEIIAKPIEIPIIEKYFPIEEAEEEIKFVKKIPVKPMEMQIPVEATIIQKPAPAQKKAMKTIKEEMKKPQPLVKYIQYSHAHAQNPFNPYRYFPLPHFPTTKLP